MPQILHTAHYEGEPWDILKSVVPEGFTIKTLEEATQECLIRQVIDADYLLVSGRLSINEEVLTAASHLKMIQRTGVGMDMLDMEAVRAHHIPVYVNAGVNARSVAEHTMTLMLCCLKNIPQISQNVKNGIWKKQQTGISCNEIFGKTIGLVGMGAIGKQVSQYLKAFGASVYYTDPYRLSEDQEQELNVKYVSSFQELLPMVDILSFHCPLTSENKAMLNAQTISMMKRGAMVVNTARGKLIDNSALYRALVNGHLRSAGLDVHDEEPIKKDSPLIALNNVIMTPHIGGLTLESFTNMLQRAIDNIVKYENGELVSIKDNLYHIVR